MSLGSRSEMGYGPQAGLIPAEECFLKYGPLKPLVLKAEAVAAASGRGSGTRLAALWSRLRSSRAVGFLVQYLQQSSWHGVGHISTSNRRHPIERVLWVVLVGLAWYGAFFVSMSTWSRFQNTPTVTSLERDYMAWNTTFPSITICPSTEVGKFDPDRVKAEVQRLQREFGVADESTMQAFVEGLAGATIHSLSDIPKGTGIPGDRFLHIIERVSMVWNFSVVVSLTSDPSTAPYNPILVPNLTELGICYSFNSLVAPFVSPKYWRLGASAVPDKWGLLEVNPMDGSVFAQLSSLPGDYALFVHGPGEVPDVQTRLIISREGQLKHLEVSALAVHTTQEARMLSPEQRNCRFTDEPQTDGVSLRIPVYSYNLCRRACRAKLSMALCRCVPHLFGPMYDEKGARLPICDAESLQCIVTNLSSLQYLQDPVTGKKVPCKCLSNCNDVSYMVVTNTNSPWFLGTDLKWSLSKYPRMRLRRNLLFGVTDLLVHIGSAAGLFLGCSVLSVIELVYFFTLRLYWYSRSSKSKKSSKSSKSQRPRAPVVTFSTPPGYKKTGDTRVARVVTRFDRQQRIAIWP